MNNQDEYKEDLLRLYLSSERIEKTPEGFTSKVMTRIQLENQPLVVKEKSWRKNLVPVISALVTVLMIALAFLIPGSQNDSFAQPVFNLVKNIKFTFPVTNLSSLFRLTLPSVTMYVFIGILILTLFDKALYGIFHREK